MNDLRIIITEIGQLRSQTIKTKIKRFLLRKRKIRNVVLLPEYKVPKNELAFAKERFKEIKQQVIQEMKAGKRIPVKY